MRTRGISWSEIDDNIDELQISEKDKQELKILVKRNGILPKLKGDNIL